MQRLHIAAVGHPLPSPREWDQEGNLAENQHWKMQIAGSCFSSLTWIVMVLRRESVQCRCQCQCKRRCEKHSSGYLGGIRGGCSCPVWNHLARCTQMLSLWRSYSMVHHPPGEPVCPLHRDINSQPPQPSPQTAQHECFLSAQTIQTTHSFYLRCNVLTKIEKNLHSRAPAVHRSVLGIPCS